MKNSDKVFINVLSCYVCILTRSFNIILWNPSLLVKLHFMLVINWSKHVFHFLQCWYSSYILIISVGTKIYILIMGESSSIVWSWTLKNIKVCLITKMYSNLVVSVIMWIKTFLYALVTSELYMCNFCNTQNIFWYVTSHFNKSCNNQSRELWTSVGIQ